MALQPSSLPAWRKAGDTALTELYRSMRPVQRAQIPFLVTISTAASIAEQSGNGGNQWTFKTDPPTTPWPRGSRRS